jgi:hypothetical protein
MVHDSCANDQIKLATYFIRVLDWHPLRFKIREVVFLFEPFSVIETRGTDVDTRNASCGMAKRILRRLPCPATSNQDVEIGSVLLVGPEQMIFSAMPVLVLPFITSPIQVFNGWWVRMIGVKLTHGIRARFQLVHISIALSNFVQSGPLANGGGRITTDRLHYAMTDV